MKKIKLIGVIKDENDINGALEQIQKDGHEVLDIKYSNSSCYNPNWGVVHRCSALIIYDEK